MKLLLKSFLILASGLWSLNSVEAQRFNFPNSNSEKNVQKVQDEIFGNEISLQVLQNSLRKAYEGNFGEAYEKQIGLSDYVEKLEGWLIDNRGVRIRWPEGVYPVEKAKFLTDMVVDIRPYGWKSSGNRNLGLNINYFRSEEMAEMLHPIYGESAAAKEVELQTKKTYQLQSNYNVTITSNQQTQLLELLESREEVGDALQRNGVEQSASDVAKLEASLDANSGFALVKAGNVYAFVPVEKDADFASFREQVAAQAFEFKIENLSGQSRIVAHVDEKQSLDPAADSFGIVAKARDPLDRYSFFSGNTLPAQSHIHIREIDYSSFYASSGEVAGEIYSIADRDYADYLAKNEAKRLEREARALKRQQDAEARALARRQAEMAKEQERHAKQLAEEQAKKAKELEKAQEEAAKKLKEEASKLFKELEPEDCEELELES